jgi:hypothetical protein
MSYPGPEDLERARFRVFVTQLQGQKGYLCVAGETTAQFTFFTDLHGIRENIGTT